MYGCWVILVASGNATEFGRLFYTFYYTHCWELMKSVWSLQLVTAICDEGDGLALCEQLS
jgi:hypothetical protein